MRADYRYTRVREVMARRHSGHTCTCPAPGPGIYCLPRHPTHVDSRRLTVMTFCDVASNICLALNDTP